MKKETNFKSIIYLLVIFISTNVFGQETGSFSELVDFNGEQRKVNFYVPDDYNPENQYQLLIGLHGLGDNSQNYSAAIIGYLRWNDVFENTIFAFPDGGEDQGRDFMTPEGDEEIIATTINWVKENYSIDEKQIILQGFSLGGRTALVYGLDNSPIFKGLLLNTPAVQGAEDVRNNPYAGSIIDYSKASEIPIFIIHGEDDLGYLYADSLLNEYLIENNGIVERILVPSMGHTVAQNHYTIKAKTFINNPYEFEYDADIVHIQDPGFVCTEKYSPVFRFRNTGSQNITQITFEYEVNGQTGEFNYEGDLEPYKIADISAPELTLSNGMNDIYLRVKSINNGNEDENPENNSNNIHLLYLPLGVNLPVYNTLSMQEEYFGYWTMQQDIGVLSLLQADVSSDDGSQSYLSMNSILFFYTEGTSERMYSPPLNLTSVDMPGVMFDVSYNYTKYTPPYVEEDLILTDTLEVLISTDCGQNYEVVFKKWGEDLASFDEPLINKLSINTTIFTPTKNDWDRHYINLEDYKEYDNAVIQFKYISGQGGVCFLDNIRIESIDPTGIPVFSESNNVTLYPNPAVNNVNIELNTVPEGHTAIRVYDGLGNYISTIYEGLHTSGNIYNFNVDGFSSGVYYVKIESNNKILMKKFIVR